MSQTNYQKVCQKVVNLLPQKQKEVIERRFGLRNGPKETLQKIGDDFGITRERVRQIEREGLASLASCREDKEIGAIAVSFSEYLNSQGGLKREDILLKDLGKESFQNQVYFLLTLGDPFYRFPETDNVFSFWALERNIEQKVAKLLERLLQKLENVNKPLNQKQLLLTCQKEPAQLLFSSLEIAKRIDRGPLGEFGLTDWSEIKPRGVRDAAYLALKKEGKPLHFREIAQVASGLEGEFFQQRNVLPQTVHNELIRDDRFVLVGRGIYALKEWGYHTGTVCDVILDVLKKAEVPLTKEAVINEVLGQRLVKPNTILLNLNNGKYFIRNGQGRYSLKKL